MARMNLNIYLESHTVEEGIDILTRLKGLTLDDTGAYAAGASALTPATMPRDAEEMTDAQAAMYAQEEEAPKRPRRTKAQIEADNAAAANTGAASSKPSDPFGDQVREVVKNDSAITVEDVKKAMIAYQDKGTPAEMQALFRKYDGAERLSELKPEHYAAVHADLTA